MLIYIIIFLISIILVLGMLMFRAWEIKTLQINKPIREQGFFPKLYFRQVEKIMLYLTKHIIQWIVLVLVKYWFILITKTKKWSEKNLPRIFKLFKNKPKEIVSEKYSFVRRAVLESRSKIRHIKEKVRKEHE